MEVLNCSASKPKAVFTDPVLIDSALLPPAVFWLASLGVGLGAVRPNLASFPASSADPDRRQLRGNVIVSTCFTPFGWIVRELGRINQSYS